MEQCGARQLWKNDAGVNTKEKAVFNSRRNTRAKHSINTKTKNLRKTPTLIQRTNKPQNRNSESLIHYYSFFRRDNLRRTLAAVE